VSNRDGVQRAYSMRPDGSRLTPLLPRSRALVPAEVSRDGRTVGYRDRASGFYVSRADGTGLHRVVRTRVGSAVLSPEAKTTLDQIAQQALKARGYVLEVRGFASADGSEAKNRMLSQRRADAVVQYLAYTHNIPLRRIVTPFGYGESQAVADNTTRAGRAQNRRVEVKILVNKGLLQNAPVINTSSGGTSNP
jgi:outer membrane protein OmpA-like peptidoglycan-associated protein